MRDYRQIPTTVEVYLAIKKAHPNLVVYGSYSAPDGDHFGNPSQGVMETSFGFRNGDYPILYVKTTWDIDRSQPHHIPSETHEYWLCHGIKESS